MNKDFKDMKKVVSIEANKKFKRILSNNYEVNSKKIFDTSIAVGSDYMNTDYITRPEFQEHQKHLDTRFDGIDAKIALTKDVLSGDIKNAISELKDEINDKKVTSVKFWIGISVPAILSIISIIATFIVAWLF